MNISNFFIGFFLMMSCVAFGQDFNEIEPNNTALTANNITLPKTLVGNFLTASDLDFFKVTIAEGGVLTLNGTTSNASRLTFRVFDGNQVELAGRVSGGASQPLIMPCIVKAGIYFIQISDYNGQSFGTGGYRVQAFLDRTDACEYNGTFNTACTIPLNTTVACKIWGIDGYTGRRSTADNDMFKIVTTRGGVLRLNLRQIADGQRPLLRVFNDIQKELVGRVAPTGVTGFAMAANIPEAGIFYVELADYNGDQIDNLYALDMTFDISDNCEYNNNFTKACDYTIGQLYQGKMCGLDGNLGTFDNTDSDFFVFNVGTTGLYNFRLTGFPTGSRMSVRIFNETQQELSGSTSGSNVNQFNHAYTIPRAGRYYVVLQEYNGAQYCDALYRFQIGLATPTSDFKNDINLSLAPNPATHQLFVELQNTEGEIFRLQIADALGRIRAVQTVNAPQTMLSIADLPIGLYWLTMTTADGRQAVQKFVKQ
jgi:Secretion system C-terminal sorting domain